MVKFISDFKMSNTEAENGGEPSEGMDLDVEEVTTKDNPVVAGNNVPVKAKKTTEVKRQVKKGGNSSKKRKVAEEVNEDTNEEDDSPTVLREKLRFYKEKADITEDRLMERNKELKEERAKYNAEQKRGRKKLKSLKRTLRRQKGRKRERKKRRLKQKPQMTLPNLKVVQRIRNHRGLRGNLRESLS